MGIFNWNGELVWNSGLMNGFASTAFYFVMYFLKLNALYNLYIHFSWEKTLINKCHNFQVVLSLFLKNHPSPLSISSHFKNVLSMKERERGLRLFSWVLQLCKIFLPVVWYNYCVPPVFLWLFHSSGCYANQFHLACFSHTVFLCSAHLYVLHLNFGYYNTKPVTRHLFTTFCNLELFPICLYGGEP